MKVIKTIVSEFINSFDFFVSSSKLRHNPPTGSNLTASRKAKFAAKSKSSNEFTHKMTIYLYNSQITQ